MFNNELKNSLNTDNSEKILIFQKMNVPRRKKIEIHLALN